MKKLYKLIFFCMIALHGLAQNTWTQKADFFSNYGQHTRGQAVGFVIGSKGYIGTGCYGNSIWDFSSYDGQTDTWSPIANLSSRYECVSFTINGKAYVGLGESAGGNTNYKDFYRYDPTLDTWTQIADFPGGTRYAAVAFAIGGKGYVGCGAQLGSTYFKDFWEYNPANDTWTQKADFGGAARYDAVGFAINGKGYIGTGRTSSNNVSDFWEYTPSTNTWVQKANYGGGNVMQAVGFSIGNSGFIGTGYPSNSNFWEYNQLTNTWTQKANFIGTPVRNAVGFSIGNKGYIGTGDDGSGTSGTIYSEFYEFDSGIAIGIDEKKLENSVYVFPNPATSVVTVTTDVLKIHEIKIVNLIGEEVLTQSEVNNLQTTINISNLKSGVYFMELTTDKGVAVKKIIKN